MLSGLASLAFAAAGDSLTPALPARFLQGVVSGVVFSVGSAWVGELSLASGEGAGGRRAAFAMTAGFALGPLTSGLLGAVRARAHGAALPRPHGARGRRSGARRRLPETVDLARRSRAGPDATRTSR